MTRRRSKLSLLLVLCSLGLALLVAPIAEARSGGSFGGSRRSGGSSYRPSSGGSSYRPSSGGSSYRPSSGGYAGSYGGGGYVPVPIPTGGGYGGGYGPGYAGGGTSAVAGVITVAFIVGMIVIFVALSRRAARAHGGGLMAVAPKVDVATLELGIQATARHIQGDLERLARTMNLDRPDELARLLREAALAIHQSEDAITHAHVGVDRGLGNMAAEAKFAQRAMAARSKFDREIVRGETGGVRQAKVRNVETDGLVDEDGDFSIAEYFVVSFIVALERGPKLPERIVDWGTLRETLDQLGSVTAEQLLSIEVVWSPAAESDNMSKEDMLLHYPELMPL